MKNSELLEQLAKVPPEEDLAREPRWKALLEGAISEKEMAALEEEAQRSEEARRIFDAYRPLDAAVHERIATKAMKRLERKPPPGPTRLIALLGSMTLSVGVWWFVLRVPPLPEAAMEVMTISAEKTLRGDAPSSELPHLGPGSTFTAQLRPSQAIDGKLEARAFLVRDERARVWPVPIELAPGGAVRISGTKEALFAGIGAGRWEVMVVVGRPGKLPSVDEVARLTPEERRKGTKYFRVQGQEIELRDSHEP